MNDSTGTTNSPYFAPLLPWQHTLWSQLTQRVLAPQQALPHALLAAGMQGLGKRAFIWRVVAWLLCRAREQHPLGACGRCESCQWLKSGTHPSLRVLPLYSLPMMTHMSGNEHNDSTSKANKKTNPAPTKSELTIKVDDIRALQPFIYQGGQGMRICVLDYAEKMTIAAANALLKTLEEPQAQVYLFLISDSPTQLLATIKSRVQQLPLQHIDAQSAHDYVAQTLGNIINRAAVSPKQITQLLQLANGAPLAAIHLAGAEWYGKRALWLTTWQALRSGKRSAIAASDYWQTQLDITDFMTLTDMMLVDMRRVMLGLSSVQPDINIALAIQNQPFSDNTLQAFSASVQQTKAALQQNVQEKFAYDKLMQQLARL